MLIPHLGSPIYQVALSHKEVLLKPILCPVSSLFYHRDLRWLAQAHMPQMFLSSDLGGSVRLSNIHLTALSWDVLHTCDF
jgi:hypothetical protein